MVTIPQPQLRSDPLPAAHTGHLRWTQHPRWIARPRRRADLCLHRPRAAETRLTHLRPTRTRHAGRNPHQKR
ncbi:MAG: hypothetical protein MZV65_26055 [Chromatiales bacterium]|nr:hypothetical protein [Chromatiales bacterium]